MAGAETGSAASVRNEAVGYHFIVVVWGGEYVDLFLRVVLPTHLSPGNLPSMPRDAWRYRIYTPARDAQTVLQSSAYAQLARVGHVELREIPEIKDSFKYEVISECHRHAIHVASQDEAALVFLAPDWAA